MFGIIKKIKRIFHLIRLKNIVMITPPYSYIEQWLAVSNSETIYNSDALRFFSKKNQLHIISKNPDIAVNNAGISQEVLLEAIKQKPSLICDSNIGKLSDEMIEFIIDKHPSYLPHIKKIPIKFQNKILRNCPTYIVNVKNVSDEILMKAIERSPNIYRLIYSPSKTIIDYVAKIKPELLFDSQHKIDTLSDDTILLALSNDGRLIRFFNKPTIEMKKIAIENNPHAIRYIKKPSKALQTLAVSLDPNAINFINKPCIDAQVIAVQKNPNLVFSIKDISRRAAKEVM